MSDLNSSSNNNDNNNTLNRNDDNETRLIVRLEPEEEFRFEVDFNEYFTCKLTEGKAEYFGTELALNRVYKFVGGKCGAIFTYHGATLEIESPFGKEHLSNKTYTGTATTMKDQYLKMHEELETMRNNFMVTPNAQPPRVLVVGPASSGKSTVSKILLNYAVRKEHKMLYLDLDCSQNDITFPGTISLLLKNELDPIDIEEEFTFCNPLTYFYGETTPEKNMEYFKILITHLRKVIDKKLNSNMNLKQSGFIVNTGPWVEGPGYQLLLVITKALNINHIIVMGDDRLTNNLKRDLKQTNPNTNVTRLERNPGVVNKTIDQKSKIGQLKIKQYFYGITRALSPHSITVRFDDIILCRIGSAWKAPTSALPIGQKSSFNPCEVKQVEYSELNKFSILGVSHANTLDEVLTKNIFGVIYVTKVDVESRTITVLSPSPGKSLPGKYVILGHISSLEL
ncbi:hypothetical protein ABK040_006954 [Willaertia magna]